MKQESKALICGTIEALPRGHVVVGSKIVQCQQCGESCWMAPSTQAIQNPDDTVWCMTCAAKKMAEQADSGEDVEIMNPSSPQLEEIKKHFAARTRHARED